MRFRNGLLLGTLVTSLAASYTAAIWPHNTDEIEVPTVVEGLVIQPKEPFRNQVWELDMYFKKFDFREMDASTIYEIDLDPSGSGALDSRINGASIILNREEGRLEGGSSITADIGYHIPTNNMEMITQLTGSYRVADIRTSNKSEDVERNIGYAAGEIRRVLDDPNSGLYRHLDDLDRRANPKKRER